MLVDEDSCEGSKVSADTDNPVNKTDSAMHNKQTVFFTTFNFLPHLFFIGISPLSKEIISSWVNVE